MLIVVLEKVGVLECFGNVRSAYLSVLGDWGACTVKLVVVDLVLFCREVVDDLSVVLVLCRS